MALGAGSITDKVSLRGKPQCKNKSLEKEGKSNLSEGYRVETWQSTLHERSMSCKRAYSHGNKGAIFEAFLLCADHGEMLPKWLQLVLDDVIKEWLKRRGRNGRSWLDQYKQDMIDFWRYSAVEELRDHGIRWADTDKNIYELASELLSGSGAQCSPDTVKQSYRRVKKRSKDAPGRYMMLRSIRGAMPKDPPPLPGKVKDRLWKDLNSRRTDDTETR